jgi:hypothetical protein
VALRIEKKKAAPIIQRMAANAALPGARRGKERRGIGGRGLGRRGVWPSWLPDATWKGCKAGVREAMPRIWRAAEGWARKSKMTLGGTTP